MQTWYDLNEDIRPGVGISSAPGKGYWHAASSNTGMIYIASQEYLGGGAACWMEKVSSEPYLTGIKIE